MSFGHNQSGKWRRRRRVKQLEIKNAQLIGILHGIQAWSFVRRLRFAFTKR
jgi:hypothetical protein